MAQKAQNSRFIESPSFPLNDVNEASAKEKLGGGRPEFWEMVFWWTRKPLVGARAFIAATLLPADISPHEFKYYLRLNEGVPHRKNPNVPPNWRELFSKAKFLDPFAGFGSIPLEAIRLGVGEVVAVELLPTAYVFLKAVLEYPKWAVDRGLGQKLVKDVERWGNWVTEQLKKDPDIVELYDEDVAVYIGTWEVKCPHCGKWTPLVGNWWLARVAGRASGEEESEEVEEEGTRSGEFRRLAWMEPVKSGDTIAIQVRDLNRELGRTTISAKVNARQGTVVVGNNTYRVPQKNIDARREVATCLHCNNQIRRGVREWYVKEALRDWNQKLEQYLSGQIDLQTFRQSVKARPRLLVKVKIVGKDLEFEPCTEEDNGKLWKALEKLKQMWGDPDMPTEQITPYGVRYLFPILYGFDKWFKLFNPRQLLTLVKLVKLIREAGKRIEEEKLREGWSREEAYRYAETVITYLAIALVKQADYNSVMVAWNPASGWGSTLALLHAGHTLSFRGIAMSWNFVEYNFTIERVGYSKFISMIVDGLSYLVSAVSGSPSRVRVLLDDATVLSKLSGERFDVIVTDPPYRDDVPYAELSDFYYVWLKRALSDVLEIGGLPVRQPRFLSEAFFSNGVEIETQWRFFADKEVSEDEERSKFFGGNVGSFEYFKQLLAKSFKAMSNVLSEGGLLVTYYAHTSPEAWEALLEAGWRSTGFRITAAHAVVAESAHRVTARGKAGLDISIVAVWRKGVHGQALADQVYAKAVEKCTDYAATLIKNGFDGVNLFVGVLGCTLSEFTKYEKILGVEKERGKGGLENLVEKYIYPATAEAIARAVGGKEFAGRLGSLSLFYLLAKVLISRRPRQVRRTLDRSTMIILAIGTRNDVNILRNLRIVVQEGERFRLLEPPHRRGDLATLMRNLLTERGVDPRGQIVRSSIDMLHLLEFYAVSLTREELAKRIEMLRNRYPAIFEEAVNLATVLAQVLPNEDPERELARRVVEVASPGDIKMGLDKWIKGGG